ncbi:biopolymer transporter ExbD [Myxococcaceae bacterium GXIMD 01537]
MIEGINVTPLVDITLVLLIIFIVTAKMIDSPALPLDLPHASQGEEVQTLLAISLTASGQLLVDGVELNNEELQEKARQALARDPELRAVIQADGSVAHRQVIAVLDQLKAAGLTRVAFGTVHPAPASPSTQDGTPSEGTRAAP